MPITRPIIAVLAAATLCSAAAAQTARPTAAFPTSLQSPALEQWVAANTTIKPEAVIAVGGGRVVAEVNNEPLAPGFSRLTIRTELVDAEAAQPAKALSETNTIEVNCNARLAKVGEPLQYAQHNMVGAVQIKPAWSDWTAAAPGTTMDQMMTRACAPWLRTSAAVTSAGPASAPPPSPEATPDSLPAPKVAELRPSAAIRSRSLSTLVQISASTSKAEAQGVLAAAKARHGAMMSERQTRIEPARVRGRTFYRSLIAGFSDATEAYAFCAAYKIEGGDCIIRQR